MYPGFIKNKKNKSSLHHRHVRAEGGPHGKNLLSIYGTAIDESLKLYE